MRGFVACLVVAATIAPAAAAPPRSAAERAAFQRAHPCPATGRHRGPCPGYVIDHVHPLCAGGADHRSNMQWQTLEASVEKDRWERRLCRHLTR